MLTQEDLQGIEREVKGWIANYVKDGGGEYEEDYIREQVTEQRPGEKIVSSNGTVQTYWNIRPIRLMKMPLS